MIFAFTESYEEALGNKFIWDLYFPQYSFRAEITFYNIVSFTSTISFVASSIVLTGASERARARERERT